MIIRMLVVLATPFVIAASSLAAQTDEQIEAQPIVTLQPGETAVERRDG